MGKFTETLGLESPIIQAPMAGVQDSALCIAVSRAGGLGSLPCAMLTPEMLLQEAAKIRSATDRPFNLNFFCHSMQPPSEAALKAWLSLFEKHYSHYNIPLEAGLTGSVRETFGPAFADALEQVKPSVVSFHFGLPEPELLVRVRSTGAQIISTATTLEEAIWLEEQGVDAIIAQGLEAGGHRGMFLTQELRSQLSTTELVTQLVAQVKAPIIAAGGIGSPDDVAKYLDLGAQAVQVGTAYLLCEEAKTSQLHRCALARSSAADTELTNIFSGRLARGINNAMLQELGPINTNAPAFPYAALASAPLRRAAEERGVDDFTPLWSGTNTSGCKEISAAELTRSLSPLS